MMRIAARMIFAALLTGALFSPAHAIGKAESYYNEAEAAMRKGDYERAVQFYQLSLKYMPNGEGIMVNLGIAQGLMGDHDSAIATYNRVARINPNNVFIYANRALSWIAKGDLDRALADEDQALRTNPKNTAALVGRCFIWGEKDDTERALADCNQALKIDPKNAIAYGHRASIYFDKGDLDDALADYSRAATLDPSDSHPLTGRGDVHRAKGELDQAIADFDLALRADSNDIGAHTGKGQVYEARGLYDQARAEYQKSLALPNHRGSRASPLAMDNYDGSIKTARARLALLSDKNLPVPNNPKPAVPVQPKPAEGPPAETSRRIALIIGNGGYPGGNALANPPNDARAVAGNLRDMGFEVQEGIDLDRAHMDAALHEFLLKAASARLALLFYAGHGLQVDGRNFLLPVDSTLTSGATFTNDLTSVDTILAALNDQIRTNIVILDACRDNPLAPQIAAQLGPSRSIAVRSGLAAQSDLGKGATLGAGTLIAFATAPGQVALDGDGKDSPFSTALIRHIGTPGLELNQMLTRVRADVVAVTKGKQVPWTNSSLLGEVYLVQNP